MIISQHSHLCYYVCRYVLYRQVLKGGKQKLLVKDADRKTDEAFVE